MINPVFRGTIKQGNFIPDNRDKYRNYLCAKEGRVIECVFRPETKFKSDKERGYYWAVIIPILCENTGYGDQTMHEYIKDMFYPKITVLDKSIPIEGKNMTTIQTEEMHTKIREWASEFLNCYIPLPNEVDY
jgi:hypothetical protein